MLARRLHLLPTLQGLYRLPTVRSFVSPPLPQPPKVKPPLVQRIKHEMKKIWQGFKDFYGDTKFVVRRELEAYFLGSRLSLREKKHINIARENMWKMIPFSLIVVIPFAEVALPPLLFLFPNMIPSYFLAKEKYEQSLQKLLNQRLVFAQNIHAEVIELSKNCDQIQYGELIRLIRDHSHSVALEQLLKQPEFFTDYCNFRKMSLNFHLNMSMFLGMDPWTGFKTFNKAFIRPFSFILQKMGVQVNDYWRPKGRPLSSIEWFIVRRQVLKLVKNVRDGDRMLLEESIDDFDYEHLRACCVERGIETSLDSTTEDEMKETLKDWVFDSTYAVDDIHLPNEVLFLSRIFHTVPNAVPHATTERSRLEENIRPQLFECYKKMHDLDRESVLKQLRATKILKIHGLTVAQQIEVRNRLVAAVQNEVRRKETAKLDLRKHIERILRQVIPSRFARVLALQHSEDKPAS